VIARLALAAAVAALVLAPPALADPPRADESAALADVRAVLAKQVAAWNVKDLDGYMRGYWNSPELTFYSGGTVTRGWTATLERYRRRYQGDGREMGTLEFRELEVLALGPDAAMARGRWHLALSGGRELGGRFTVILRHFAAGWLIVHDHTSVD
jgi:beta-aspartyl-peptidase (threonine type)